MFNRLSELRNYRISEYNDSMLEGDYKLGIVTKILLMSGRRYSLMRYDCPMMNPRMFIKKKLGETYLRLIIAKGSLLATALDSGALWITAFGHQPLNFEDE